MSGMSAVQLSGRLPGSELNGLTEVLERDFIEEETPVPVVVVAVVTRKKFSRDDETSEPGAIAKIKQIEPLTGSAAEVALGLLAKATKTRTGDEPLPGFGEEASVVPMFSSEPTDIDEGPFFDGGDAA